MSKKEKSKKEDEEEIEEEEEQEEEVEEEVEEESDHTYTKEIETNNTFIISLQLIKLFENMDKTESDNTIINFLKNTGLPMHFNNEETLSLYLYFHRICIPFYDLLKSIKSDTVLEIVMSSLQESYYLLADDNIKHFNYLDIAKKSFANLKISEEDTNISKIPIVLQKEISRKSSDLQIKKLILDLGFQSNGRLFIKIISNLSERKNKKKKIWRIC